MRILLNSLLIVILVFPLNAGAAAWMAMSMDDTAHLEMAGHSHAHALQMMPPAGIDGPVVAQSSSPHSEHNSADCEEHCASCSNHCSSTAIISSHHNLFDTDEQRVDFLAGMTLYRHEMLFRPPIFA